MGLLGEIILLSLLKASVRFHGRSLSYVSTTIIVHILLSFHSSYNYRHLDSYCDIILYMECLFRRPPLAH